ncbi:DUF4291 domain-containing protein [Actinopolymorpha sp. B17G11]|uniref:DUF4291 domain-containing protein n=1 Tax=Actinopolymorpha sp. B17G11 TaxID=3160861 RepID=UPI0032E3DBAD
MADRIVFRHRAPGRGTRGGTGCVASPMTTPIRQVRAAFDTETIIVYQAYGHEIADAALAAGTFVAPFSMSRMTWIKPSFLWMMYRCGWASKPGQERVLAIRMRRTGFEAALRESCLSHFDPAHHKTRDAWRRALVTCPVRVQWDPERTTEGQPLPYRSLQVGLSGSAVTRFVTDWIQGIGDITDSLEDRRQGLAPLPQEVAYPLPATIAKRISANV